MIRWLVVTAVWHLPRACWRCVVWLLAFFVRCWRKKPTPTETADGFYRSYRWRRLRVDALEANRRRYGMLACECCGMVDVASWHVDHIYPRSTHQELALDPDNLQVLCDACNIGKGTHYTTNWRGGPDPLAAKRSRRIRLWAR